MTSENTKYMELMSIPSHRRIFKLIEVSFKWILIMMDIINNMITIVQAHPGQEE